MKILIIGLGSIAQKHINALNVLKIQCQIYALRSNPNSKIIDGVINIYSLDLIKELNFDFAIISNPTHLHYKYISILSEFGVNLFIEKPAVFKIDELNNLSKKIVKNNILTYVACNLRFHPCIVFLKNFFELNSYDKVNEVNIYCGSYLPEWRMGSDFREIYSVNSEMGGGVHLDLFHEIDYSFWIFGMPLYSKNFKSNKSNLKIDSYDYANYLLIYRNFALNIVLNYFRRDAKRVIEIVFDDFTWTVDLLKNSIIDNNSKIIFQAKDFNIRDTYVKQMSYYLKNISLKSIPMNSFEESINPLSITLQNE
jgi:predicted dehydrogenase